VKEPAKNSTEYAENLSIYLSIEMSVICPLNVLAKTLPNPSHLRNKNLRPHAKSDFSTHELLMLNGELQIDKYTLIKMYP
jgi:hypothetical protein